MSQTTALTAVVFRGVDVMLLARVVNVTGAYITQASCTTIKLYVYDKSNNNALLSGFPLTLTISSVVYDTLQTDAVLWTVDSTGFNFKYRLPGATALLLANLYDVVIKITATDGTNTVFEYLLSAKENPTA